MVNSNSGGRKGVRRKLIAGLALASSCLAPFNANAHTDSLGFIVSDNSTAGLYDVKIFYGSWHPNMTSPEGALLLQTSAGVTVGTQTFALVPSYTNVTNGIVPTGLVAGTNYFFPDSSTSQQGDLTGNPSGHSIYAFQSATFTGLIAGSYLFGYTTGSTLSINWTPSDTAINNGSFTITSSGNLGGVGGTTLTPDIDTAQSTYTTDELNSGAVNPVFNGGTLSLANTGTVTTDFTVNTTGGTINTDGYNGTFTGVLSDASGATGGLTKTGSGTLTLSGANSYSGGTTVADGTLRGDATSLQGVITNNATLEFAQQGSGTFSGTINGTGDVLISSGTETLSGSNGYTGATTIANGATLAVAGDGSIAASSGVTNNGTLAIAGHNGAVSVTTLAGTGAVALGANDLVLTNASGTFSGAINGAGGVNVSGGTETLSGSNGYTGVTTIANGATLAVAGGSALSDNSAVSVEGTLRILASEQAGMISGGGTIDIVEGNLGVRNDANTSFMGTITGVGSITKSGAGTLTLVGTNSFTGVLTVQQGTVLANDDVNLGAGTVTIGAATLAFNGDVTSAKAINLTDSDSTIDTGGHVTALSGALSGEGALNVTGAGILILTGVNSQNGISVYGGTLAFNSDEALGAVDGIVDVVNDSTLQTLSDLTINHTVNVDNMRTASFDTDGHNVVMAGNITGSGVVRKSDDGTLTLSGANSQVITDISQGTLVASDQGALGASDGNILIRGNARFVAGSDMGISQNVYIVGDNARFDTGANSVTLTGTTNGSSCLNKDGTGTLNMVTDSANDIGACIHDGTLRFNSDFVGNVWVDAAGTAAGSGRVFGDMIVSGKLAPGNSPGQLIVAGSVTQQSGSSLAIDIDGRGVGNGAGNYDTLVLVGATSVYTAGGTVVPITRGITGDATNNFTPNIGDVFQIVSAEGGITGTFEGLLQPTSGIPVNTRFDILYRTNAVLLTLTADSYRDLLLNGKRNATSFGGAIDKFRGTASVRNAAPSGRFLDGLMGMNQAQLGNVLEQASGEIYADSMDNVVQTNRISRTSVTNHLNSALGRHDSAASSDIRLGHRLWGTINRSVSNVDGDVNGLPFEARSTAMTIGLDGDIGDNTTLGAAFSYGQSRTEAGFIGSADANSYQAVLYGQWKHSGMYGNAVVVGGIDDYVVNRRVDLSTGALQLSSDPDGSSFGADLEVGKWLKVGDLGIIPSVGLSYDGVQRSALTERGDEAAALQFNSDNRDAFQARVGLSIRSQVNFGSVNVAPYLTAIAGYDFGDLSSIVQPTLHGIEFDAIAPRGSRTSLRGAAGLGFEFSPNVNVTVGYQYDYRRGANTNAVSGGLSMRF